MIEDIHDKVKILDRGANNMKYKFTLIISFLSACFFMQALSASSNMCSTLTSIKTATDYQNHLVYVDADGNYHFPSTLPDQLKSVTDDAKTMNDLCSLRPSSSIPCKSDSLGPYIEFHGLENLLRLQPKEGSQMLGEDRGQVYFWSNKYTQKFCNS